MNVKQERTGWRDLALNDLHRRWGWNCPMVDIDFLALEYDNGKAAALVEYKHEFAQTQYSSHPSYAAMIDLGNRAGIPVLAVRYAEDFSWWRVVPLNDEARKHLPVRAELSTRQYVELLYKIRGREMPPGIPEEGI